MRSSIQRSGKMTVTKYQSKLFNVFVAVFASLLDGKRETAVTCKKVAVFEIGRTTHMIIV